MHIYIYSCENIEQSWMVVPYLTETEPPSAFWVKIFWSTSSSCWWITVYHCSVYFLGGIGSRIICHPGKPFAEQLKLWYSKGHLGTRSFCSRLKRNTPPPNTDTFHIYKDPTQSIGSRLQPFSSVCDYDLRLYVWIVSLDAESLWKISNVATIIITLKKNRIGNRPILYVRFPFFTYFLRDYISACIWYYVYIFAKERTCCLSSCIVEWNNKQTNK